SRRGPVAAGVMDESSRGCCAVAMVERSLLAQRDWLLWSRRWFHSTTRHEAPHREIYVDWPWSRGQGDYGELRIRPNVTGRSRREEGIGPRARQERRGVRRGGARWPSARPPRGPRRRPRW